MNDYQFLVYVGSKARVVDIRTPATDEPGQAWRLLLEQLQADGWANFVTRVVLVGPV